MSRENRRRSAQRFGRMRDSDAASAAPAVGAIPDDPTEFYDRFIYWPHKQIGRGKVRGLNSIQRDFLNNRASFRTDDEGSPKMGSDIAVKPRQVFFTSLCLGLLIWAMLKFPGFQAVTVLHKEGKGGKITKKLWSRFRFALRHLPQEWIGGPLGGNQGVSVELPNGSVWTIYVASGGEARVEGIALSTTIHGLHLSEFSKYVYPEVAWGAMYGALADKTGWMIAEGSPPRDRNHMHMAEYRATRDGEGSFMAAHFWAWWQDEGRMVDLDDERARRVLDDGFKIEEEELLKERDLDLSLEQVAWRRWHYLQGLPSVRRRNRLEFPEDDESCFGSDDIAHYLDITALDAIDANTRKPIYEERVTPSLIARLWATTHLGHLVVCCDQAGRNGLDYNTAMIVDWRTRDQLAEIHGRCYGSEMAKAVEWLIWRLTTGKGTPYHEWSEEAFRDDLDWRRYTLCQDRSQEFGLTQALAESRLHVWRERKYVNGKWVVDLKTGLKISGVNRHEIINQVAFWAQGPAEPFTPQCRIRSTALAAELRSLEDSPSKIEAAQGHNDDLAFAWGMCHYIASKVMPASEKPQKAPTAEREERPRHEKSKTQDRSRTARRMAMGKIHGGLR